MILLCSETCTLSQNIFMFAVECASRRRECGCSSFDVETINNEFRYNGWYRAKCIAIWYARQAIPRRSRRYIYASKKTESQVDMKEAKRMTLFIIMINVSRNGINAIMKNDPIKNLLKTRRTCGLQSPPPSLTKHLLQVCLYDRPQAHNPT